MADEPRDTPDKEDIGAQDSAPHDIDMPHEEHEPILAHHTADQNSKKPWWHFFATKKGKIVAGVVVAAVVIGVLLAIPATRYGIVGSVVRKDLKIQVMDSKTGKPVTDAEVSVPGTTAHTDKDGKATLGALPVGNYTVTVKKRYYTDAVVGTLVPILSEATVGQLKLVATGRQVPVVVNNKITGKPLDKATITAGEATAITDASGEATLVLPAGVDAQDATIKADAYNQLSASITVTEQKDPKNTFAVTPAGKIYFLSKRTGIINVMKSDLDGANSQVVVPGTGKEEEGNTVLLSTRDWKYLVLQSKRDNNKAKLYILDTSTDKLDVMDEGNVEFTVTGWRAHTFIYRVNRTDLKEWQPKQYALKSYNADTKKLTTLDESSAEGTSAADYRNEFLSNIVLLESANQVVYTKNWNGNVSGKQNSITSVQPDGGNKKVLKAFGVSEGYIADAIPYNTDEIYYRTFGTGGTKFYEYENGAVNQSSTIKDGDFGQFYPTYLLSPSGQKTFWYEPRDGKNTLLIGDKDGKGGKEIATLTDYVAYGWYSDDYLLASKNGSELYILPQADGAASKASKITDYHKPNQVFRGYGGGYGGF